MMFLTAFAIRLCIGSIVAIYIACITRFAGIENLLEWLLFGFLIALFWPAVVLVEVCEAIKKRSQQPKDPEP